MASEYLLVRRENMNIANIINFVRAVEPREKDNSYLPETLKKELELCNRYNFPSTVLLQYDALILSEYRNIIKENAKNAEIGLWFEVVQPLVEAAGMNWRGRFPWDWHNDVGFLIGYTPEERKRLIDTAFAGFYKYFGYYPEAVGSWHIDAFSLSYMKERYGIVASCNCKDQFGTDGYTIWGGYYNGAYYPSKNNMLCPADCKENQIDVPVFRMLGSDPIHQYDLGLGELNKGQSVMSLEPVYDNSGADRNWVEWYLSENFNGKSPSISYTQFGQENSFGWEEIKKGLPMQFEILDRLVKEEKITLQTLSQSGKMFIEKYPLTPPEAMCIDSDCLETDYKTVWYMSRAYRINLLYRQGSLRIRDLHLFDSSFCERYLDSPTINNECFFSNIPVVDGFRFSSKEKTAGAYFCNSGTEEIFSGDYTSAVENETVIVKIGNDLTVLVQPETVEINSSDEDMYLDFRFETFPKTSFTIIDRKKLQIEFQGFKSEISLSAGHFENNGEEFRIVSDNGIILISLVSKR